MEESSVLRSHVVDAHADSRVLNLAIFEQRIHHRPRNLRWNGKAHACEASRGRDQERIDADDFAVRIHQRPAGISGINGRVRLDEFTRLARVVTVRIWAVQRAHDAASHGKTEVEWIAERQYGLSGLQHG